MLLLTVRDTGRHRSGIRIAGAGRVFPVLPRSERAKRFSMLLRLLAREQDYRRGSEQAVTTLVRSPFSNRQRVTKTERAKRRPLIFPLP